MRGDWEDLAAEIEKEFSRYQSGQYNDLLLNPQRAAGKAVYIFQQKASSKMQPTFKPSLFDRFMNSGPVRKLKQNLDENPAAVLLGAAAVITATAKLIDVTSSIPSKRAYAREANERVARRKK